MNKSSRYPGLFVFLFAVSALSVPPGASAQSFCFLSAATFYEQVYCELQAKGEARGLPPFHQFKRNDEKIQAVLLKRPAERAGITLPKLPKSTAPPENTATTEFSGTPTPEVAGKTAVQPRSVATDFSSISPQCVLRAESVICDGHEHYRLTGNRLNHRLAASALTDQNIMALPIFSGDVSDSAVVNHYLANAYRQYINKMHEIGLAGATMTYGKFYFLFYDLHEKGLSFSQRFETMYGFLKRDKASMGVSEKIAPDTQLLLADCDLLDEHLLLCSREGRNYLYVAVSD